MGRYSESVCKQCRREGEKLFLKGDRCLGAKCALDKRNYPPGVHTRRVRPSDYGVQLREKQKVKRIYGVYEKQFKNYYQKAVRRTGVTGHILLELLETRLDNIVYRLGWAKSRNQARQMVNHGHITINGKKVDIPSYQVKPGQKIGFTKQGDGSALIDQRLKEKMTIPAWMKFDAKKKIAEMLRVPERDEIEARIEEQQIVEYYSR